MVNSNIFYSFGGYFFTNNYTKITIKNYEKNIQNCPICYSGIGWFGT